MTVAEIMEKIRKNQSVNYTEIAILLRSNNDKKDMMTQVVTQIQAYFTYSSNISTEIYDLLNDEAQIYLRNFKRPLKPKSVAPIPTYVAHTQKAEKMSNMLVYVILFFTLIAVATLGTGLIIGDILLSIINAKNAAASITNPIYGFTWVLPVLALAYWNIGCVVVWSLIWPLKFKYCSIVYVLASSIGPIFFATRLSISTGSQIPMNFMMMLLLSAVALAALLIVQNHRRSQKWH